MCQKYAIITCKPPITSIYQVNKRKRRYKAKWADDYPWLRYSASKDAVFFVLTAFFSMWESIATALNLLVFHVVIGRMLQALIVEL